MTVAEQLMVACLKRSDNKVLSLVQKKWLDGSEVKQYRFIMDYYREHGEMVGMKTFCDKFRLDASMADSRPSFYLNQLKERFIFAMMSDNIPRILKGIKEDPREKLHEIQELIATLAVDAIESKDILYSADVEARKRDYEERMASKGVTYLSMGNDIMDTLFYGYRKTDLITVGGKAGQGKSWLLVYLAYMMDRVLAERSELGESWGDVLFITNEMGEDEIMERLDCIKFRLPFGKFMKGELSSREAKRYYSGLEALKAKKSKLRIVGSCQTIDELTTLIGLYQPSLVFVDGSYLMEPRMQEGWEKIAHITRNLKRIAKNFNVPIVNSTQLRRGSGKSGSKFSLDGQDDFAYGSSYVQDSDIAFRLFQDADMKFYNLIGCEVVKGRRVVSGTTLIFQNDLDNMAQSITLPIDDKESEPEHKTDY